MKQRVELVNWEDVRQENKLPVEDNNEGYTFGVNLLDDENNVIDVEWFLTDESRQKNIETFDMEIVTN